MFSAGPVPLDPPWSVSAEISGTYHCGWMSTRIFPVEVALAASKPSSAMPTARPERVALIPTPRPPDAVIKSPGLTEPPSPFTLTRILPASVKTTFSSLPPSRPPINAAPPEMAPVRLASYAPELFANSALEDVMERRSPAS